MTAARRRVSEWMSDDLYQRALGFDGRFTLDDLVPAANVERSLVAHEWVLLLVERGELQVVGQGTADESYEWVNA